ncbi:24975_t:CDS:2, partial [Racocetra persica]
IYFANLYNLYIDTDYQVEDLINLPEKLEPHETSYISNSSLQLTQYSDPTNITYLEDSFFSERSISYQLPISTSLPKSVILNPNFSTPHKLFGFETDQILDQINIEANPTKKINLADNKETTSTNHWDTLLNNTSIREALANYLQDDSNIVNLVYSNRPQTIPVKYQTTISNKPFTAIIDSEAAISMIIQQAAKEIRLEIDILSNSLISSVLGKQVRPLGVIKNVPVKIAGITILISIEIYNQAIEGQPIVSKVDDDWEEEYKDKELISHEVYTLETESNNIEDSGWTIYQQKPKISRKKNQKYRTCRQTDHYFEDCQYNKYW